MFHHPVSLSTVKEIKAARFQHSVTSERGGMSCFSSQSLLCVQSFNDANNRNPVSTFKNVTTLTTRIKKAQQQLTITYRAPGALKNFMLCHSVLTTTRKIGTFYLLLPVRKLRPRNLSHFPKGTQKRPAHTQALRGGCRDQGRGTLLEGHF